MRRLAQENQPPGSSTPHPFILTVSSAHQCGTILRSQDRAPGSDLTSSHSCDFLPRGFRYYPQTAAAIHEAGSCLWEIQSHGLKILPCFYPLSDPEQATLPLRASFSPSTKWGNGTTQRYPLRRVSQLLAEILVAPSGLSTPRDLVRFGKTQTGE